MVGLYTVDWVLIDIFDTREDAMSHALYNGIGYFKIQEL